MIVDVGGPWSAIVTALRLLSQSTNTGGFRVRDCHECANRELNYLMTPETDDVPMVR
jgi:hypothetical protein